MAKTPSRFADYLRQNLRVDEELVVLHLLEALETPDLDTPHDYQYLLHAIHDVVLARAPNSCSQLASLTRHDLSHLLKTKHVPSLPIIQRIFEAIGLQFSEPYVAQILSGKPKTTPH